ncbi:MAG: hypothetical protein QM675_11735 [Protaetiibacter sp.]
MKSNEELAQLWLEALGDVEKFREISTTDCRVWHSSDNLWVSIDTAIENVYKGGGLPPVYDTGYTVTEHGFLVQFSAELAGHKIHNTIIVKTENGLAVTAEEYIGLELDVAAVLLGQG